MGYRSRDNEGVVDWPNRCVTIHPNLLRIQVPFVVRVALYPSLCPLYNVDAPSALTAISLGATQLRRGRATWTGCRRRTVVCSSTVRDSQLVLHSTSVEMELHLSQQWNGSRDQHRWSYLWLTNIRSCYHPWRQVQNILIIFFIWVLPDKLKAIKFCRYNDNRPCNKLTRAPDETKSLTEGQTSTTHLWTTVRPD